MRRVRRADQAFLPSALQILETPPAPLAGLMMMVISVFFVVALVWSWLGMIDVIAVAQGKLQPIGRIKTVQSIRSGRVVELRVDNGALVHRGDPLMRLDPREAMTEREAVLSELANFRAEVLRRRAALAYVQAGLGPEPPAIPFPDTIPSAIREAKARNLAADLAALAANIQKQRSQADQKKAERNRLMATIEAQKALVNILRERVDMRQSLVATNSGTRASVIDASETLAMQTATLAQETGQIAEIESNLQVIDSVIEAAIKAFVAENSEKLDQAERQVSVYEQRLERTSLELDQTTIRSPIDGIVQSSSLTTIGQVVNPGDELMRIVPEDAGLEVECYLPNKDIGFVKVGQPAVLKIESFPFTRYGTIDATVTRVASDAIPEPDASLLEQDSARPRRERARVGADRIQNLVFPITLRLVGTTLNVDGTAIPLRAGMAVTAEIKTGQRRLIDYVLSPIRQIAGEALRER
ncbi:HlyD family type I secretion periplasmic adaptor subunit [Methylobacterium sp. Leaf113]|uniref:HlyD family type I secretion periplasmic adaptor subunit n=1 Tax=Methylobacterium sp. Leaf113 TaxID=1736259 RepID=UPI00138EFC2A|nr:HlyD family type I secretion periplasmic adaptor subunit [Methylobacterium sp. Leaf113]